MKALILCLAFAASLPALASDTPTSAERDKIRAGSASMGDFGAIPVQHEGRVKPLDTFARAHLLAFNSKESTGDLSATAWLAETLFEPDRAYERPVFDLPNPDTVALLGLEPREGHRYSFAEIFPRLREQRDLLTSLRSEDKDSRTPAQTQLLELDVKAARFFEISRSLSLVLPLFRTDDEALAGRLGLEKGREYDYMEMLRLKTQVEEEAKKNPAAATLASGFAAIEGWALPEVFRVFPPQYRKGDEWASPWKLVQAGDGSPVTAGALRAWHAAATAYHRSDWPSFTEAARDLRERSFSMTEGHVRSQALLVERAYNGFQPFQKAVAFYVGAFLLLLGAALTRRKMARTAAAWLLGAGAVVHAAGILARIFVMGRPPVSTLYESIVFVAWIAVALSLVLERVKGRGLGTLIGSVTGSALLFVSFSYAAEGDTMGVLVAVLNTNFWLATHVVCITIGYGICVVGGVLGHVYLAASALGKGRDWLGELYRSMVAVSLVALFFALFGTILGGIWADQSWGRFWGWDPKENGALWIVLWLLFLMHGRLAGRLGASGYALGMVFTNVVVALAWFGVNLLNVGLHSYGFTENIALNLLLFCVGETGFGLLAYHHAKLKALRSSLERISYFPDASHPQPE